VSDLTPAQRLRLAAALGDGVTVSMSRHDAMQLARTWEQNDKALSAIESMKMQHQVNLQKFDTLARWMVKTVFVIGFAQTVAFVWMGMQ
jgi:hypothetical protein